MTTKDLYMNVHSIFIYKSPNPGKPKYLITNEWINKLWYINIIGYSEIKRIKVTHDETLRERN